jgi:acetylornithine deacetylase/succinyl-diaminopimelate desuccinylase-like protein
MEELLAVDRHIDQHLDTTLNELRQLCAQPSIAAQGTGMEECAQLVAAMLRNRGFEVRLMPTPGYPAVYGERPGRSNLTILLYNHYDVQAADPLELWESPPFEPTLRGDRLYARGVSDDKGHILCRLAALDALLAIEGEPPCNVKFLIEGEEEIGSPHLPELIGANVGLLAADACLWESGGVDHRGVPIQHAGLRGICYVELEVRTASRDAHSGTGGSIFPNAAWRMTWALSSLKGPDERIRIPGFYDKVRPPSARDLELLSQMPDMSAEYRESYSLRGFIRGIRGGAELNREQIFSPTCTICGITAGYQGPGTMTVLPSLATAKVDFRLVPDQDPDDVVRQLRQHLDAEGFSDVQIVNQEGERPARTDPDDPFLQLVAESARDVYGVPQVISPMSGGTGPNYPFVQTLKVPVAMAGISYPRANVHGPNEHIILGNFVKGVKHTARILARFAAM